MIFSMEIRKVLGIAIAILLAATLSVALDRSTAFAGVSDYMDNYIGADADKVGSDFCLMCHADSASEASHHAIIDGDEDNDNYGFGCEGCHGPGGNHNGVLDGILNPDKMDIEGVTEICTGCHEEMGAFEADAWEGSTHFGSDISCLKCHGGHSGLDNFLLNEDVLEICGTCHSDLVDAFDEGTHGNVEGMEITGCNTCHNPHT